MGTWGTGIFDDDLASDIQNEFEKALDESLTVKEATQRIIEFYQDEMEDEDEGPIIYLALAALQLEQEELQAEVRKKALEIIESGEGLVRWEEAKEEELVERKQVLEDLKAELKA
jgi:Domain of unknown function (DUF4259)